MQTAQATIRLPLGISEEDAELLLAMKLFETGRISLGQAAELSGYTYPAFLEVLRHAKIPVANYTAEELRAEVAS
jgi:predicted HTH domain antitoxin